MKEIKTIIHVQEIPQLGAWTVLKNDESLFLEGRDGWWDDINSSDIKQIQCMGVLLPIANKYNFYREGAAVIGKEAKTICLTFKLKFDDLILTYIFKKVSQ